MQQKKISQYNNSLSYFNNMNGKINWKFISELIFLSRNIKQLKKYLRYLLFNLLLCYNLKQKLV